MAYGQADLLSYAPVAREHAGRGFMTVQALCAAAVELSDNTATNLLLKLTGGPQALTAWMRSQGDPEFDLSDNEPGLNLARFGDRRNTTTPRAMCASYRRFAFADALAPASRERLRAWLIASPTGAKRLRAGLPSNWQAGDKTGTFNGPWFSTIDVAIAMPPERAPIVIAAFVTDTPDTATAERAMVEVARKVALQRAG
ncbi:class A beta-lactamase [Comamonas endophytica]|uniref:class A beta-lactamase n=1 Tax=Comamonas endophytica TaxID=2949090 RepID=UPI0036220171